MKKKLTLCLSLLLVFTLLFAASCGGGAKNISVVVREDGSGTKSAFMEIIGLKGKADVSGAITATGTTAVLAEVKSNPYAIAYESLGYVTSEVKKLKIDGVEATVENIKNGTYKIARPLQIVYKESTLENPLYKAYYDFLVSEDAQKIIRDEGYVSMLDNAPAYTVNPTLSGKITLSGSTSLQPLMILLAEKFQSLQSSVTVEVGGGGSGQGYNNAQSDVSNFGMISESFKQEKAPDCTSYIVAKDGIAVIVNKTNALEDISLATLKNIYDRDAGESAPKTWDDVK